MQPFIVLWVFKNQTQVTSVSDLLETRLDKLWRKNPITIPEIQIPWFTIPEISEISESWAPC